MTREPLNPPGPSGSGDHDAPGAELAPGVVVERRRLLWLPVAAVADFLAVPSRRARAGERANAAAVPSLMTADAPEAPRNGPPDAGLRAGDQAPESGPLTWEEFLRLAVPAARDRYASGAGNQDGYLHGLAALAARVRGGPDTRLSPFARLDPKVESRIAHRATPFGGDGSFSFLDFKPHRPVDPRRRVFGAVWIGATL